MDLMTLLIGIGLVWTGAAFFGFPVGRIVERRRITRECEYGPTLVCRPNQKFTKADVLDDEIIY
jgi:hypothetical protein